LLARQRVCEAHRFHAYLHGTRRQGAHRPVTIAVALIKYVVVIAAGRLDRLATCLGLVVVASRRGAAVVSGVAISGGGCRVLYPHLCRRAVFC